jgi:hypothetical protein
MKIISIALVVIALIVLPRTSLGLLSNDFWDEVVCFRELGNDVEELKWKYDIWKENGALDKTQRMIRLLESNKSVDGALEFESIIKKIVKEANDAQKSNSLSRIRVALMKLRFVESYKGVREWIATLESKIKPLEAAAKKNAEEQIKMKAISDAKLKQERATKIAKYNVRSFVQGHELAPNPFQYENQVVILELVAFERMLERNVGIFKVIATSDQLLVSNLPSNLFTVQNQSAKLIVRVKGVTKVTNALGVAFTVPLAEYIDLY